MQYTFTDVKLHRIVDSRGEMRYFLETTLWNNKDVFANANPLPKYYIYSNDLIEEMLVHPIKAYKFNKTNVENVLIADIKEEFRIINHVFPVVVNIEPHMRISEMRNFVNRNGKIPEVYTQIILYVHKYYDQEEKRWMYVEAPELICRRILNDFFVPIFIPFQGEKQPSKKWDKAKITFQPNDEDLERLKEFKKQGFI